VRVQGKCEQGTATEVMILENSCMKVCFVPSEDLTDQIPFLFHHRISWPVGPRLLRCSVAGHHLEEKEMKIRGTVRVPILANVA